MEKNTSKQAISQHLAVSHYKVKDFFLPAIIFTIFTVLAVVFFQFFKDQAIWSQMKVAGGNAFEFCEQNKIGTALVQTANTWSNLGFLIVGLFLLFMGIKDAGHKEKDQPNLLLKYPMFSILMGASILYLFIGSFFYHASLTLFFQMIDQTGMYAIILSFMGYNIFRVWPTLQTKKKGEVSSHKLIFFVYLLINVLFIAFLWKIDVNILFPAMFLAYLVFTVAYNKKNTVLKFSTKLFGMALYILLFSTAFWILDRQDVLCDPNSLWQGHALWHILNAVVLLFIYLHYRAEKSTISTLNIYEKN